MRRNAALVVALLLVLQGCGATGGTAKDSAASTPVVDRTQTQAMLVTGQLEYVQRLLVAKPAEQSEIVASARREFEDAPTPSRQLRYALVLATPGHASTDIAQAEKLMRELMATPEVLVPAERALAQLELAQLEKQTALLVENQRLQAASDRSERDRNATASRKLQAELDENARLRKELDEAQKKLDAIANIERSSTERKP